MPRPRRAAFPGSPRHFFSYWRPEVVERAFVSDPVLNHSASDQYWRVRAGDILWIVTTVSGRLSLVGRLEVKEITSRAKASRLLRADNLWDAKYHALARRGTEQLMHRLDLSAWASDLRFVGKTSTKPLEIVNGFINAQQLQTMRALTSGSSDLVERLWTGSALEPTADLDELDRRVRALHSRGPLARPAGNPKPRKNSFADEDRL
jgi:hypothetical protein